MTAQVSDTVIYQGEKHVLAAFSDGEPFTPTEHGYRPFPSSTACWRGYLCEYQVREQGLYLHRLHVNHQEDDEETSAKNHPPRLNGVEATASKSSHIGNWTFEKVGLPIPYTGGLVVARGFIQSLYVHMGFHPAWKYEQVHELIFESGRLTSATDLSERMAAIREQLGNEDPLSQDPSREEIETWIEECFRRDYRHKRSLD